MQKIFKPHINYKTDLPIPIMTSSKKVPKKRVVVSFENLSDELREALKARYPLGFADNMIRIDKPNGEFFYGVVLEAEDTSYLIKLKVKIDQNPEEEFDKDQYGATDDDNDEIKGAEEIADSADDTDD